jgi:hypothetical protein
MRGEGLRDRVNESTGAGDVPNDVAAGLDPGVKDCGGINEWLAKYKIRIVCTRQAGVGKQISEAHGEWIVYSVDDYVYREEVANSRSSVKMYDC